MQRFDIEMSCPLCLAEGHPQYEKWYHGGCGGRLSISDDGIVVCEKCGKRAHITLMYFSCSSAKHKMATASKKNWGTAICTSVITRYYDSVAWFERFLKNL